MCGRFAFFIDTGEAERIFGAKARVPIEPRYNIAPRDDIYTITNETADEIGKQRWGLIPSWVDDPPRKPQINARAETVDEKPYFRSAFKGRRCLVPANGFFEWKQGGKYKIPYWVTREDGEPFAMAGLWERWSSNGEVLETVVIITTDANEVVEEIHDRMPVIFERDEQRSWLEEEDPEELKAMLDPIAADSVETREVSPRVNNPGNDDPSVIEPVASDQSGLGDF